MLPAPACMTVRVYMDEVERGFWMGNENRMLLSAASFLCPASRINFIGQTCRTSYHVTIATTTALQHKPKLTACARLKCVTNVQIRLLAKSRLQPVVGCGQSSCKTGVGDHRFSFVIGGGPAGEHEDILCRLPDLVT